MATLAERGRGSVSTLAAAAVVLLLVAETPIARATYPYYDAHGFAITSLANREWRMPIEEIERVLVLATIAAALVLLVLPALRRRGPAAAAAPLVLASVVLAWNVAGEVYAAQGENGASQAALATLPPDPSWLDELTGGRRTAFLGQAMRDNNPLWELEFWNRSLEAVMSTDGTAPGPGPVITTELASADGTLSPDPEAAFLVAQPGIDVMAPRVRGAPPAMPLYRLDGPPRLASAIEGVQGDGWMGSIASYTRYDVRPGVRGHARVTLSRQAFCGPSAPGDVTARIGPVVVGEDNHPKIGEVTDTASGTIDSCEDRTFILRAPDRPWRVELTVSPTFVPNELDPTNGELRSLGGRPTFAYVTLGDAG
jgi:hypothetical protein